MVSKAIKIAILSGLISALVIPVSYFLYGEITINDPAIKQYNGFSLLAGIGYVPFTIAFSFLASLALLKTNLDPKPIVIL